MTDFLNKVNNKTENIVIATPSVSVDNLHKDLELLRNTPPHKLSEVAYKRNQNFNITKSIFKIIKKG